MCESTPLVAVRTTRRQPAGANKAIMTEYQKFRVAGEKGLRGTVFTTSRFLDESEFKLMRLDDGREFMIPSEALVSRPDGSYQLQLPVSELDRYSTIETHPSGTQRSDNEKRPPEIGASRQDSQVLPAIEERLRVEKRPVDTGRVMIHKHVTSTESTVDEPLLRENYDVQHVPVNRIIDHPPEIRHEGDTTIIPVLEEVLVVEKRLILREELHIVRRREEHRDPQKVTLRKENVEVEKVKNSK
jgi:uncharacterized protein (TIGR02271 family)